MNSVIHARPSTRPTITRGTTTTDPGELSAKVKLVNATGPVPSPPTSSRTSSSAANDRHQWSAAANRSGPRGGEPGDLAPADQALAVAHPAQRVRVREQVEQPAGIVHRAGPHAEPGRQRGDRHLSESRDAAAPTPVRAGRCGGGHVGLH